MDERLACCMHVFGRLTHLDLISVTRCRLCCPVECLLPARIPLEGRMPVRTQSGSRVGLFCARRCQGHCRIPGTPLRDSSYTGRLTLGLASFASISVLRALRCPQPTYGRVLLTTRRLTLGSPLCSPHLLLGPNLSHSIRYALEDHAKTTVGVSQTTFMHSISLPCTYRSSYCSFISASRLQ
jgi:hypothetical protein